MENGWNYEKWGRSDEENREIAERNYNENKAKKEAEQVDKLHVLKRFPKIIISGTLAGVVAVSAFLFVKSNQETNDNGLTGISMEEVQDAIDNRELNEQKIADAKAASDVYDKIAAGEKETLTQEDLNVIEGFDQNDYKPENYEQGMATPETKVNTFEEQPKEEIKHVNTFSTLDGYPPLSEGISR